MQLLERKGGKVCDRSGETSAYIDDREEIVLGDKSYTKAVRRSDCKWFALVILAPYSVVLAAASIAHNFLWRDQERQRRAPIGPVMTVM